MARLVRLAWRKRRFLILLTAALGAAFAGFRYTITFDQGRKMHLKKQLAEASRMPGRLLT